MDITNNRLFLEEYKKLVAEIAEEARLYAIQTAIDATPPNNDNKMRGRNTITGHLQEGWDKSDKEVKMTDSKVSFDLKNEIEYASYVDQGHSMDQHFVLGLYINPYNGLLEYEPDREKAKEEGLGITVGTKTSWVEGLDMTGKAKEAFIEYMDREIERRIGEIWERMTI